MNNIGIMASKQISIQLKVIPEGLLHGDPSVKITEAVSGSEYVPQGVTMSTVELMNEEQLDWEMNGSKEVGKEDLELLALIVIVEFTREIQPLT